MLRYVGESEATVWVETDSPCEVEVLDTKQRTFEVEGHHYALLYIEGVEPSTSEFMRTRRDIGRPPYEQVADFEEYCHLYWESWQDPVIRWLFSTVSTAMIWDDHDVHDDWNTSEHWVGEMRGKHWWNDRIV